MTQEELDDHERRLLDALRAGDDPDAPAVYADWLEARGRADEAQVVRLRGLLRSMLAASARVDPTWRRLVVGRPEGKPRCVVCGRPLRSVRDHNLTFVEEPDHPVDRYGKRERYLRAVREGNAAALDAKDRPTNLTGDGEPARWGDYGDNVVCDKSCGHQLALRLLTAVAGLLHALPAWWREDLKPPPEKPKRARRPRGERPGGGYTVGLEPASIDGLFASDLVDDLVQAGLVDDAPPRDSGQARTGWPRPEPLVRLAGGGTRPATPAERQAYELAQNRMVDGRRSAMRGSEAAVQRELGGDGWPGLCATCRSPNRCARLKRCGVTG